MSYAEVLLESWRSLMDSDDLEEKHLLWDLEMALTYLSEIEMEIIRGLYMTDTAPPERTNSSGKPKGGMSSFAADLYPCISQNAATLRVWKVKQKAITKLEGILQYEDAEEEVR